MIRRTAPFRSPAPLALLIPLSLLAGCGGAATADRGAGNAAAAGTTAATANDGAPAPTDAAAGDNAGANVGDAVANTAAIADTGPRSCAATIGKRAAAARVALCRHVSPATHPPCNAANSCAMIEDEIARSCALIGSDADTVAGCTPAPTSGAAAAAVVTRYYAALDARDFGTAWDQWGENGAPGQTRDQFVAGFAHTRATHVTIGQLPASEGAAGSVFQRVPVVVEAVRDDGQRQRFTGDYVVRRVNDVDGATAEQRRWHLASAKLAPAR